MTDPDPLELRAPAYELAFVEAGRALDAQERTVNELRSRAGVLIAAAAVTTSFFGSNVVGGARAGLAAWLATVSFALIGVAVLAVLWPRREWEFSESGKDLIARYVEPELLPLALIHRDLALHYTGKLAANAAQLAALVRAVRVGVVLFVVEVGAWLVALGGRV
jgi:tetrahydromethanopterin S-methyltransferase subunit B